MPAVVASIALFGTISDSFASGLGAIWTSTLGASQVSGRARLTCDTGFNFIQTASAYTVAGSAISARLFPPAATGGTTSTLGMSVNSATAGTSLAIIVDSVAGTIKFTAETGFFDPNSVSITYDATNHAYCRIRESGGTVFWETSPTGATGTWTNRRTTNATTPAWVGTDAQNAQFTAHRDAGTNNFAEVDDFNIEPSAAAAAQIGVGATGLAGTGTQVKVAKVVGTCGVGLASTGTPRKVQAHTGAVAVGVAGAAAAKKVAKETAAAPVGFAAAAVEKKVGKSVGVATLGLAAIRSGRSLFGTISDSFASGLGAIWTQNSGSPTGTDGRARVPCGTGFASIRTASIYTIAGSAVFARLTPPGWSGATTDANIGMSVNSATAGTSLSTVINRYAGTIRFSSETGFFDGSAVSLTYDPSAHAFCQIRETAGTTYWETSPSGKAGTWTTRKSISTPAWVGTDAQDAQFTAHRDAGTTDHAEVDYFNVAPTATGGATLDLWMSPQPHDSYSQLSAISQFPHAKWVGDWDTTPTTVVAGYAAAAAGKTMILPIYAIPNRDSGGYSGGGFPDQASYLTWVTGVKNGAGTAPVWYILEPDALGLAGGFSAPVQAERLSTLSQAVTILKQGANARVYIDASFWLTPSNAASLLQSANVAACEGFATNVSAFETIADCYTWCDQVVTALNALGLTGKKYVIDSGRSGRGKLTSGFGAAATPWVTAGKEFINPPGRGLGLSPRIPVGQPDCHALLWVKGAGGSDGNDPGTSFSSDYFGENAPGAGTFWVRYAENVVAFTDPANLDTSALQRSVGGTSSFGLAAAGVTKKTAAKQGTAAVGVVGTAAARKVAQVAGASTLGVAGTGSEKKAAAQRGAAAVGLSGSRSGTASRAQTGSTAVGLAATGAVAKKATGAGTATAGVAATGLDKKVTAARGTATIGLATTRSGASARAQTGITSVGLAATGLEKRVAVSRGTATTGLAATGLDKKAAPGRGTTTVGLSGTRSGVVTRAVGGACTVGVATRGTNTKLATPTGVGELGTAARGGQFTKRVTGVTGVACAGFAGTGLPRRLVRQVGAVTLGATGGAVTTKRVTTRGAAVLGALPLRVEFAPVDLDYPIRAGVIVDQATRRHTSSPTDVSVRRHAGVITDQADRHLAGAPT